MRRLVWLLALPYVMQISTQPIYSTWTLSCDGVPEAHVIIEKHDYPCSEIAAALNEAHEQRTEKYHVKLDTRNYQGEAEDLYWKDSKKACVCPRDEGCDCQDGYTPELNKKIHDDLWSTSKNYTDDMTETYGQDQEANPEKQIKRPEQKPIFDYPKACEGSCSEDK